LQVTVAAAAAGSWVVAGALFAEPAVADLSMPPCPRQAPRPPVAVVPSLQVTVGALAAWTNPGQSIPDASNAKATRTFACRPPEDPLLPSRAAGEWQVLRYRE
jgi:hypothetical protein